VHENKQKSYFVPHVFVALNARASAVAVSGDGSTLIVRGTHTELVDDEATVVSQFLVVDVVSGQLVGTVGQPCRGVSPATAEFVDETLLVTYPVLSQNITGITQSWTRVGWVHPRVWSGWIGSQHFPSLVGRAG